MGFFTSKKESSATLATGTGSHNCRANEQWTNKYWEPANYPGDPLAGSYACRICGTVTRQQQEPR
jgi:hypothetical protein